MVSIKIKNILIAFFLLLLIPLASAVNEDGEIIEGGKLLITNVDVEVDGNLQSGLDFNEDIADEAMPGSNIKFSIEANNTFTEAEGFNLTNLMITTTIKGIDQDNDLTQSVNLSDLGPGDKDQASFDFNVPLTVEEGSYDVTIFAESKLDNGSNHIVKYELELDVQKSSHDVRILSVILNDTSINCGEEFMFSILLMNLGLSVEDNVRIDVTNNDLNISDSLDSIVLNNNASDESSMVLGLFSLKTLTNVSNGVYPINILVTYNNNFTNTSTDVDLGLSGCSSGSGNGGGGGVFGQKLKIKDLDVEVNGKTDSNIEDKDDGYEIRKKAEPGSIVEFKFEIENLYTDEEDLKIKDIEIIVTIEDIDDGDDLDEESGEFDLRTEDDKKEKLVFKVPLRVDDEKFDVVIEIEGRDENGTRHRIEKRFLLEVEKENHELRITKASIIPTEVSCARRSSLDVEILNTGEEDEDDVTLEISSQVLGIDVVEDHTELESGNDDDASYSKQVDFDVADNIREGTYPIEINAFYDSNLEDSRIENLLVSKCIDSGGDSVSSKTSGKKDEVDVIIVGGTDTSTGADSTSKLEAGASGMGYITIIILLAIVVLVLIVFGFIELLKLI